jgi:Tfp pilus assembly protein PilF
MDNANIQTGIQYFKSGNKSDALQIFLEVLKREPNNEIAWL